MKAGKALGYLVVLFILAMACFLTLLCGLLAGGTVGFLAGGAAGLAGGTRISPQQPRLQFLLPTPVTPPIAPRPNAPTPTPEGQTPRRTPAPQATPQTPRSPMPIGQTGAYLLTVVAGSPAEKAGLRPGDLIVSANGTPINDNHPLTDVVRSLKPGETIPLEVIRTSGPVKLQVTLGSQALSTGQTVAYLGVTFDPWPPPDRAN